MMRLCHCHCLRRSQSAAFSDFRLHQSAGTDGSSGLASGFSERKLRFFSVGRCSAPLSRLSLETSVPNLPIHTTSQKFGICVSSANKATTAMVYFSGTRYFSTKASHYDVLGVEQNATTDDIRAAFLKQSKECHPDLNRKDPNNHIKFVEVNEAYSVLSKPVSRREYDLSQAVKTSRSYYDNSVNNNASGWDSNHYYHHPSHYYDEQIYSNRDKSKDDYHKKQPYYGVKGIEKISNFQIVAGCLIFMLCGMVFHTVTVKKSSDLHIKSLDARDVKTHELWMNAKKNAEMYTAKEQSEKWMQKAAEIKSSRGSQ